MLNLRKLAAAARAFQRRDDGAIAIIFGLALILIVFAIGLAIDTGRAVVAANRIASSLDAATLAGAQLMAREDITEAEVREYVERSFDSQLINAREEGIRVGDLQISLDPPTGTVQATVGFSVPLTFSAVLGKSTMSGTRSSTAIFKLKGVELAMVLDITGSMDTGGKLSALKQAATDIVDILLPDGEVTLNKVSLVPYSASVNAGPYASIASDGASIDNCVFERVGAHAYSEDPPGPGDYSGAEDPMSPSNPNYSCPAPTVLPLTNSKATLLTTVNSYSAFGGTAGHIGIAWGWYTISPSWAGIWPAGSEPQDYTNADYTKAVLIMTDGEFNTSYANGAMNATSSDQALDLCEAIRDAGVQVFTVAFQAPATAEQMLRDCSASTSNFFVADNTAELREAFQTIATRLQKLRLTR
ncbi:MAG: pilus assembly protein [Hyphomicrobiaceae bacterium]